MSAYEELSLIVSTALLIVSILNLKKCASRRTPAPSAHPQRSVLFHTIEKKLSYYMNCMKKKKQPSCPEKVNGYFLERV